MLFKLDPEQKNFKGIAVLRGRAIREEVFLDAIDLTIHTVKAPHSPVELEKKEGGILVKGIKGNTELTIEFEGKIRDDLSGLYFSKGKNKKGEEIRVITSQFEPIDARKAFPCFDHPALKARFEIEIIAPSYCRVISNTQVIKEETAGPGYKKTSFAPTPLMSTYLLYIGVGEFSVLTKKWRNKEIRAVVFPGKESFVEFGISTAIKSLEFFEEYFGVEYMLPKLDLIALPDFGAGAMENWGAIVFKEPYFLFDPQTTSPRYKRLIAEVIAHEISHQWFGNLVTMSWWDDLWLNESFAKFISYKAIDTIFPEWEVFKDWIREERLGALKLDTLANTHAVKVPINKAEEVEEVFDAISYNKGGCVLWHLEGFVGESVFREALQLYLQRFAYSNACSEQLWEVFGEVGDKRVVKAMHSLLTQKGVPSLFLKQNRVSQKLFVLGEQTDNKTLWSLPVLIKNREHRESIVFLDRRSCGVQDVLCLNSQGKGYYLSFYDSLPDLDRFSEQERLVFLQDAWFGFLAGFLSSQEWWQIIEKISFFKEPYLISLLLSLLEDWYLLVGNKKIKERTVDIALREKSLLPDSFLSYAQLELKSRVFSVLSRLDHKETQKELISLFEKNRIEPELKDAIFVALSRFSPQTWERLWQEYQKDISQEDKRYILTALGKTRFSDKAKKLLKAHLQDKIRFSNIALAPGSMADTWENREMVTLWLLENWEYFWQRSGGVGGLVFQRLAQRVLSRGGVGREDVKNFIREKIKQGVMRRKLTETLEYIELYEKWARTRN